MPFRNIFRVWLPSLLLATCAVGALAAIGAAISFYFEFRPFYTLAWLVLTPVILAIITCDAKRVRIFVGAYLIVVSLVAAGVTVSSFEDAKCKPDSRCGD